MRRLKEKGKLASERAQRRKQPGWISKEEGCCALLCIIRGPFINLLFSFSFFKLGK